MNTKRIQDAEKLVKKGEEHLKTGLFKWSPDIDSAIECFDKGEFFIEFQNFRSENFFFKLSWYFKSSDSYSTSFVPCTYILSLRILA